VNPKPSTGSVVAVYDPDRIGECEIIQALRGHCNPAADSSHNSARKGEVPLRQRVVESIVAGMLEIGVRELIRAVA